MERVEDLIDIPTYYKQFCDKNVDLNETHSIPCKFHNEVHGKSFTYSPEKHVFMCWGQCHCGGGVVQLHKLNFRLKSNEEARESLERLLGVHSDKSAKLMKPKEITGDPVTVELNALTAKCIRKAKTVEQWVELDYVMSQYPVDKEKLELFLENNT